MLELSAVYSELRKARLTKDHLRNYCVQLVLSQDITVRELVAEVLAFSEAPPPVRPAKEPDRSAKRVAAAVRYLEANGVPLFTAEMLAGTTSKLPGADISTARAAKALPALGYRQVLQGEQVRCAGKLRRLWAKPGTDISNREDASAAFEKPYATWQALWQAGYPGLVEVAP